jgi:hypothetical protein
MPRVATIIPTWRQAALTRACGGRTRRPIGAVACMLQQLTAGAVAPPQFIAPHLTSDGTLQTCTTTLVFQHPITDRAFGEVPRIHTVMASASKRSRGKLNLVKCSRCRSDKASVSSLVAIELSSIAY